MIVVVYCVSSTEQSTGESFFRANTNEEQKRGWWMVIESVRLYLSLSPDKSQSYG